MLLLITSSYPKYLFTAISSFVLYELKYLKKDEEGKAGCLNDPKLIGQSVVIITPIVSIAIKMTTITMNVTYHWLSRCLWHNWVKMYSKYFSVEIKNCQ